MKLNWNFKDFQNINKLLSALYSLTIHRPYVNKKYMIALLSKVSVITKSLFKITAYATRALRTFVMNLVLSKQGISKYNNYFILYDTEKKTIMAFLYSFQMFFHNRNLHLCKYTNRQSIFVNQFGFFLGGGTIWSRFYVFSVFVLMIIFLG